MCACWQWQQTGTRTTLLVLCDCSRAVAIELSVQPLMWNLVVCGVLALSVYAGKLDPDVFAGLMTTFVRNYIDVGKHAPLACQSPLLLSF